jgi:hypothetical protein
MSPLAVGLPAVAVFAWWAVEEGGTPPGVWYPGALLFLAGLCAVTLASGWSGLSTSARWALAALAGLTVWSFASIAWAGARGDAWDAANRSLLYLTVFALFAGLPWRPGEAAGVLAAFALAITAVGLWAVATALSGSDGAAFADGRLRGPVGYENATAALLLAAFWPALILAARRSTRAVPRALLLMAAGLLMQMVVLAQSRGSVLAVAVSLALALSLHGDRGRLLLFLAAVAVTTAASLPALLGVYDGAGTPDEEHAELVAAAVAMAVSAVVLFAAGLAADRFPARPASPAPGARWVAAGVAVIALAASFWAFAPDSRLSAGAETGRYDFWRVAANEFVHRPIQGSGAGDFGHDYARQRRRLEEPLYSHSIILGSLGHTGLVGASLLTGFLVAAFAGLRPLRDPARVVGLAAVVSAAAWLTQASIDWLWELPALTAPAVAFLGLVAGLGPHRAAGPVPRWWLGVATVAASAAAVSYALPGLAARDVERAARDWNENPGAARARLDRARGLNFLGDRPDVVAGTLSLGSSDRIHAREAFTRAVGRDPENWYAQVQLALMDLQAGRSAPARARLDLARRLNPLEPAIAAASDAARLGRPVPSWVAERLLGMAVPGPVGRRPVDCRPVLGLGVTCSAEDAR